MTDNNYRRSGIAKHRTYLSVEDTTDSSSRLSFYIYTFLVEGHMPFHIGYRIRAKTMHYTIAADNRHRKASAIALKVSRELTIN